MRFLSLILLTALSSLTFASNYPADYCHVNVRICSEGPAVIAFATSGCHSGTYVIGYKKSGYLGKASSVDAIVTITGQNNVQENSVQRVTPDWNNIGFLTSEIDAYTMEGAAHPYSTSIKDLSIAFSDGNQWDSKYGQNYHFNMLTSPNCVYVQTHQSYNGHIPFAGWDAINAELGK